MPSRPCVFCNWTVRCVKIKQAAFTSYSSLCPSSNGLHYVFPSTEYFLLWWHCSSTILQSFWFINIGEMEREGNVWLVDWLCYPSMCVCKFKSEAYALPCNRNRLHHTFSPVIGHIPPLAIAPAITPPLSQFISIDWNWKEMFRLIHFCKDWMKLINENTWQYKSIILFTLESSGKHLFSFMKWANAKLRSDILKQFCVIID